MDRSSLRNEGGLMPYLPERSLRLLSVPCLLFLSACGAKPECDSFETRNAVLQTISDNHRDPLATYAAKNSTANNDGSNSSGPDAAKSANPEKEKPLYRLGEKIVTTSTSDDKRTLKCSGAISATVGDTKASKEVNFTVQQMPDGKISVSVEPFQF
jgi:hypothetical protein